MLLFCRQVFKTPIWSAIMAMELNQANRKSVLTRRRGEINYGLALGALLGRRSRCMWIRSYFRGQGDELPPLDYVDIKALKMLTKGLQSFHIGCLQVKGYQLVAIIFAQYSDTFHTCRQRLLVYIGPCRLRQRVNAIKWNKRTLLLLFRMWCTMWVIAWLFVWIGKRAHMN